MQEFNPDNLKPPPQESYGPITPLMIEHLRATKPWVRFMSVILFITVVLMVLVALAMLIMPRGMGGSGVSSLIAIVYLALAALYVVPAYFLYQFASSIRNLEKGGGDVAMEEALGSQKSFWRFVGITTLIVICIYVIVIAFMILGATMMSI
jgi:hypothetical protein